MVSPANRTEHKELTDSLISAILSPEKHLGETKSPSPMKGRFSGCISGFLTKSNGRLFPGQSAVFVFLVSKQTARRPYELIVPLSFAVVMILVLETLRNVVQRIAT
jgi:hypothetical protein